MSLLPVCIHNILWLAWTDAFPQAILLGSVRCSAFHKCIFYIPFRQNYKRVLPFSARSNRNLHNEKSCHDDKLIEISKFFSFLFLWTCSTNHWPLKLLFLFNLCTWTRKIHHTKFCISQLSVRVFFYMVHVFILLSCVCVEDCTCQNRNK